MKENNYYKDIIRKTIETYKKILKNKKELRSEGMSDFEIYIDRIKDYKEHLKSLDLKKFYNQGIAKINEFSSDELINKFSEFKNMSNKYKEYLQSETEDLLSDVVEDILMLEKLSDNKLKEKIGESHYNELLTIIVVNSVKMSKITYQYGENIINKIEYVNRIKTQLENYTIQVVKFLKDKVELQDYIPEIINFAFGNKAKAIIGISMKVAAKIFNENKSKDKEFENIVPDLEVIEELKIKKDKEIEKKDNYETN